MASLIFLKCILLLLIKINIAVDIDWISCKSTETCERVFCPDLTNCNGPDVVIEKKGGLCGCCDVCVRLLNLGDNCLANPKPVGSPVELQKCKAGLICQDDECVEEPDEDKLPPCLRVRKIREQFVNDQAYLDLEIGKGVYLDLKIREDLWMPECDKDGNFKGRQCKTKKCMCLAKDGYRLFGNSERELATKMTCDCSVAVDADRRAEPQAWMTKPHFRCSKTGDYEELQCYENLCFCADQKTGKPKGPLVLLDHHEFLPCYKQKSAKELTYLTTCEKQEMRESKVNYEFFQKGITIQGFKTVTCDIDGTFSPRQCDPQACYCTDRNATSLRSYKIDRAGSDETKMTCRCARDEHDNEVNHARFPVLKCGNMGQFEYHQCFDKECFCVDEDGDYITEGVPYFEKLASFCLDIRSTIELETMVENIAQGTPNLVAFYKKDWQRARTSKTQEITKDTLIDTTQTSKHISK